MIAALRARHAALTRREHLLVALAGWLMAVIVLVYGVILPVGHAFDAAALRHATATVRAARLAQAVRLLDAPVRKGADGPVDRLVATSAEQAGLVLQSNQSGAAGETRIVITAAGAPAALRWLDALGGQGVVVDGLAISPSPDGTVAISATLRRPAP